MRNKLNPRIILIVCILTGGLLICCGYLYNNKNKIKNQVVLCFQEADQINKRYKEENNIIVDDCRESIVGYSREKQSILYINYQNEIVEKNISTGRVNKLNILDKDETMSNLQYGPKNNQISYIKDGCIYVYDRKEENTRKITDSGHTHGGNTYAWKNEETLYAINSVNQDVSKLYIWDEVNQENPIVNTDTIKCFTLCDDENKIYAIFEKTKFNGITIEFFYDLIEIDLISKTRKKLTNIDTMVNLILESIDNKYLIYVEKPYGTKISKVYCYDLETGKKKCIYKTDNYVIGVIAK